ncbi:MAG: phage portal protein [Dehalococcoidia bacterium]|jgi:HK97 family phage portal protein
MAIWQKVAGIFTRSRQEPVSQDDLARYLHGEDTWTGLDVDRISALGLPIVWACVRVLSETLASLPWILYKRTDRGKVRADNHPLFDILHIQPNPQQTAFMFREQLQGHLGIFGNAYANIIRNGTGYVQELWPLSPDSVKPYREKGRLLFEYTDRATGLKDILSENEVFHISGLSFDGIQGYAPLELNKQTLGLALAAKRYAAEYFANEGTPSLTLTSPGKLSEDAYKRMTKSWEESHSRWGKKHRPAILEQGTEAKEISASPDKAQLVEVQKFLTREVCRYYRMQPHMVQDMEDATYSNIEHQGIEFSVHTMRPWCVRWEQAALTQLLSEKDRKKYFPEFLMDALLRGDTLSRYQSYRIALEAGIFNADEIRELENRNEREDGGGKTYFAPQNWMDSSPEAMKKRDENAKNIQNNLVNGSKTDEKDNKNDEKVSGG